MSTTAQSATRDEPNAMPSDKGCIGQAVLHSYWQRTGGLPHSTGAETLPSRAGYVIAGGGFAGLSTALRMKELEPDADIVLVEAETVGYGASGRNGGLMSPLPAPVWLTTALHDQVHARAMGLLNTKVTEAAQWARSIAPDAEVCDAELALEAKGRITDAGLAHVARTLIAAGITHRFSSGEVHLSPRTLHLAAHTIHPYKLVLGLAAAARARGVRIVEHAPVGEIVEREGGGAHVGLKDGRRIAAHTVVLATNAYTPSVALEEPPRAKVVNNYMLATKPLDAMTLARLEAAGQRSGRFVVELNAAYVFYRVHDGRLIFGGIEKLKQIEGGDLDVPAAVIKGLRKHLAQTLDGAPLPEIAEAWGGRFHMTTTDLPIIRRSKPSSAIVLNVGYGGTGVALTLSLAPLSAALALRRDLTDRELAGIHDTMCNTRLPVVDAMRFAAGVVTTYVGERWAR